MTRPQLDQLEHTPLNNSQEDPPLMTVTTEALHDEFGALTRQIETLKDERANVSGQLIAAGIEADRSTARDLRAEAEAARADLNAITRTLAEAEASAAALDARIDAGDGTVDALASHEANIAVRVARGKVQPAEAALKRAKSALAPFVADDHLALLAAETVRSLVDVPVLVRKRASDVEGLADAVVLTQDEPTERYGTHRAGGSVKLTEVGTTGLDGDALQAALEATGADVEASLYSIDYAAACWPVTRLVEPSARGVEQFADALARSFKAVIQQAPKAGGYSYHETRWHTITSDLDNHGDGTATGSVVAVFGVEGQVPPLHQVQQFISDALDMMRTTDVHTSAGLLRETEVIEVVDRGPWLAEDEFPVPGRRYTQKFGIQVRLAYAYERVTVPAED